MKAWFRARPALCWALYDWANSAFAVTVMAGFFPTFFRQYWAADLPATGATFHLGMANAAAGLAIAVFAPLLGVIADRGGRRKQMLLAFSLAGIIATFGLFFVAHGQWFLAVVLFVLATIGFNGGIVFSDALLLDVAAPKDYNRVSSMGYAMGYLGGGLLFAVNVLMVVKSEWFGLPNAAAAVRWSFITVALWWAVFTLPLLMFVREPPTNMPATEVSAVRAAWRELVSSVRKAKTQPLLWKFLIAYWLYIDGVNTIIKMAVDYGLALGLDSSNLLGALLLTQFVAFPASLAFGRLGDRFGARPAVLAGLAVYALLTVWAYFLNSTTEFYAMAVLLGLVQGGVQSLSRAIFGQLVPAGKSSEYFGFYNLVGKFGTVLGPALMALAALGSSSNRVSILSLLLLFVGGAVLLYRVPIGAAPSSDRQ
jgi:MFS transporter, UMF1 family